MTENLMFCLGRMLWQLTLAVTAAAACKQTVATSGGRVIVNFLKMPIFKGEFLDITDSMTNVLSVTSAEKLDL